MTIDPHAPNAARLLADRAGTLLLALEQLGVRPLVDPVDLLLISLLPLAIKKILTGSPNADDHLLLDLLNQLDLTDLRHLILGE